MDASARANARLKKLREKFPSLGIHAVLARGGCQIEMGTDFPVMLKGFPGLFGDTPERMEMMALLSGKEKGGKAKKLSTKERNEKAEIKRKRLGELFALLLLDGRVRVELRFRNLDYARIWELQQDDLVDRRLTVRSKASIRVVLGTLAGLSGGP